jgi:(1->4)-alpha-D-glucan 1-alpha-D-glucosylmutase
MAKGVEDTAFYRYNRFVSLNEVGGDPGIFGRPVSAFHQDTATMAELWPRSMLTLSTHDTKRSADVRARLNVLSELPDSWRDAVERWADRNDGHRRDGWPDRNAEYLLYQTIVGAWPLDAERAVAFMAKATKEAKVHTSWVDPVADYDEAVESFVRAILADGDFLADLKRFLADQSIVSRGRQNSLAQVALLLTCPGVPDIYQGDELWDLSLVDPDNRRPVDYDVRRRLLADLHGATAAQAVARSEAGGPKLWIIRRLLEHRRQLPGLYHSNAYEPLAVTGARSDDAVAFTRGGLAVLVPCRTRAGWADTFVQLPPGRWCDLATGGTVEGGRQPVHGLLASFPVTVLAREET